MRHSQEVEGIVRVAEYWGEDGGLSGDREDGGCAYILDDAARCGATARAGSSYCAIHHAICHVPGGSPAERRALREGEALAKAVGGRAGRERRLPPDPLLKRLDRIARRFSRPDCSCFVSYGER